MENVSQERVFLHDLATPITAIRLLVKRQISELEDPSIEPNREKQLERLKKVLLAVEQLELLHADHKAKLSEADSV